MFGRMNIRGALLGVATAVAMVNSAIAETPKSVNVQAGNMVDALETLAKQCGVYVLYPSAELQGFTTAGVSGNLELREAFRKLIEGTPLTMKEESGGIVISLPKERSGSAVNTGAFRVAQGEQEEGARKEEGEGKRAEVLEEIIVTAQKREEKLQDVPISVSVVEGREMDRSSAEGITEMLSRIPAVSVHEDLQTGGTQITIRGVATGAALVSGAPTSAYYIDSVPFGFVRNAVVPDPAFYDLERLEVLRGPQGTLFGANALNGVVRVLTHEPDLDDFEFKGRVATSTTRYGGVNYRGDVAANLPLVDDRLAVRVVAGHNDLSGWIDVPNRDDVNYKKIDNLRVKLLAQPTERLTIGVSAWRQMTEILGNATSDDDRRYPFAILYDPPKIAYTAYGFDVGYDFGAFSLSSTTSHVGYSNRGGSGDRSDPPGGVDFTLASRVLAQEVLLTSTDAGAWDWTAGAFYRDAKDVWFQDVYGWLAFLQDVHFDDTSKSYALFGEVSRRFLDDKLKSTLGLRYFHDKATTEGFSYDPGKLYSATYKATTPRAVLTWVPNEDLSVYGSYSQGFRSGVLQHELNTAFFPFYPDVKPDKLSNYEIGAKGNLLDQRVTFEAAVFYIDWQDIQQVLNVVFGYTPAGVPIGGNLSINGDSASGFGADLSLTVRPARGLELGGSLSWNDLTMDSDLFTQDPVAPVRVFAKGDRLAFSPEYTASLFADYTFPIGSSLDGRFSGSINHMSSQDSFGGTTRFFGDAITTARASFSLEAAKHWTAMFYVDNLTDEYDTVAPQFGQSPNFSDAHNRPRTVGLQLEYRH